jgi:hypothetical protein
MNALLSIRRSVSRRVRFHAVSLGDESRSTDAGALNGVSHARLRETVASACERLRRFVSMIRAG